MLRKCFLFFCCFFWVKQPITLFFSLPQDFLISYCKEKKILPKEKNILAVRKQLFCHHQENISLE